MDNILEIDTYIFSSPDSPDNEVYVKRTIKNINALQKTYGITNNDIRKMEQIDGCLEVYKLLYAKGFSFKPEIGFYMDRLDMKRRAV